MTPFLVHDPFGLSLQRASCLLLFGLLVLTTVGGCTPDQDRLFVRLDAERTGVNFANIIVTDDSLLNPLDFFYVYNGGGVAVGDLNGDDRPDLYFAGNTVTNRLFLNQGDFRFRDVTETAGVAAKGLWSTGIAVVDVNQDGLQDLYVSAGGPVAAVGDRANRLYVNQGVGADGIPTFREQAAQYGIADTGYSTQSAFFDADRDGDLDLYVLNTATVRRRRRPRRARGQTAPNSNADRLYRNNGDGTFTEVSQEAGITANGYGLGLAISDVNGDGWPDVYAANDLHTSDRLYVNDGDGSFTNRSDRFLKHQSYSAMGVDIADVNNDARDDIMVLDMLPQDPRRRRLVSIAGAPTDGMWQYVRNTLQLNNGASPSGPIPFSEIGQQAGVEATGWSWAPLLADYDNDGDRDLFVSNGFGELITHLDYARLRQRIQSSVPSDAGHRQLIRTLDALPEVHLANRFFENDGGEMPQFTERTYEWAAPRPGISNGAAFADLDQDGDLDLVTNNINEVATILQNRADERARSHALRVDLHGPEGNRAGFGAKVVLTNDGTMQYHDHSPYRGYQSTVENIVHFGLGADSTADSLQVVWPDGTKQLFTDVAAGQVLDVQYSPSPEPSLSNQASLVSSSKQRLPLFREVAAQRGLAHEHRETGGREMTPLLPHQFSKNGPGLAVGDVDGNGLDDVFIGADRGQERVLYRQVAPGRFQEQALSMTHSYSGAHSYEDMGTLLFDAEGDGDLDLYVVSGSNVGPPGSAVATYQDRLYLNDGTGTFRQAPEALPDMAASGSSVRAADYDRDGDLDLFVGGRVIPQRYPLPPRSYLLRNDSDEKQVQFTDVTETVAPGLAEVGLVTDALWTDFTGDDRVDLLVVGEWMPITFFANEDGCLTDVTAEFGPPNTSGWWNSLAAGDFDRDGDTDYVVGNLGLNTRYEATPRTSVRVHAKDFDQNGRIDPILSRYIEGTSYPAHGRRELVDQIHGLEQRVPSYQAYAGTLADALFPSSTWAEAYVAEAARFETSYLENQGDSTFDIRALPPLTQTAPVFGLHSGDYDGDGHLDVLLVGNWYAPDAKTGRADAFVGALLRGDGTGHFASVPPSKSGFVVDGDAKGVAEVTTGNGVPLVLTAQNNDSLRAFAPSQLRGHPIRVRPLDRYARLTFNDGSTRKVEFYYGSTYLSQSSRTLWISPEVTEVVIHGAHGSSRILTSEALTSSGTQDAPR